MVGIWGTKPHLGIIILVDQGRRAGGRADDAGGLPAAVRAVGPADCGPGAPAAAAGQPQRPALLRYRGGAEHGRAVYPDFLGRDPNRLGHGRHPKWVHAALRSCAGPFLAAGWADPLG